MIDPGVTAPRPTASTWDPTQGHVAGAGFEWDQAFDRVSNPLAQMPDWTQHGVAPLPSLAGGTAKPAYKPPGFPVAINAQSLTNADPSKGFWTGHGQIGAVLMGASQGDTRGGFTPEGLATLPLTIANAPMYGREGVLALLTSLAGGGYQQQPDGSEAPVQHDFPIVDEFIGGVRNVADTVMKVIDVAVTAHRRESAAVRISNVADLLTKGATNGTIIDYVSSFLAGGAGAPGAWKFNLADLTANMAAKGFKQDEALAELYDLPLDVIHQIMANPAQYVGSFGQMSGPGTAPWTLAAGDLAQGLNYSVNPVTNMFVEMGAFAGLTVLTLGAGPYMGLARLGADVAGGITGLATGTRGVVGASRIATAFGEGLGGARVAEAAGAIGRAAGIAGRASRIALKASAINNAAGWSIRGFEWSVKQIAGLTGNHELADTMDRLLWEMPLSMSPGLNLMASFTARPFETIPEVLHGRLPIGTRNTAGRVGTLDVRRLGIVNDEGAYVTIAGRPVTLIPSVRQTLGSLREMSLDHMSEFLFRGLDWDPALLRTYFGEGNKLGNSVTSLKDAAIYVYLQAARDKAGSAAAMIQGATLPARAEAFFDRFAPQIYDMLKTDLAGSTHYFRDTVKSRFWDLKGVNDSQMAGVKANLGDYDPALALSEFSSWIRASNHVNAAYADRAKRFLNQPRHATDINTEAIAFFRRDVLAKYRPDDTVRISDLNVLKNTAGLIETRGAGKLLILRKGGRYSFTRVEVERILDDVLAKYAKESDGGARPNLYTPEETAAAQTAAKPAVPGKPKAKPTDQMGSEPQYGPPEEVAEARVTGMDINTIRLIRQAEDLPPEGRANLQPSRELMTWYDRWANPGSKGASHTFIEAMLARDRPALWQDIIDAWKARRDLDFNRSVAYDRLGRFAEMLTQRAAEPGLVAEADALAVVEAVRTMQDNLANPVGMAEQYLDRVQPPPHTSRGRIADPRDYTLKAGHEGGIAVHEDPISTWMATHPGIAEMWRQGEEEAFALAEAVDQLGFDQKMLAMADRYREVPMQRVSSIEEPTILAFPVGMTEEHIKDLLALIRTAAKDPAASDADRALLLDSTTHPLTKLPIVERVLPPGPTLRDLHEFTPKVEELAQIDAAFAKRRADWDAMVGLITAASRKLSLDGDWSPGFREVHERAATVSAHVEDVLPEHRADRTVREQTARSAAAQRNVSTAQQQVNRLEQARSIVHAQTGAFGTPKRISTVRGKPAAEAEVTRLRQADPASSYGWAATKNGWYEVQKAEPMAPLAGPGGVIEQNIDTAPEVAQAANLAEEALRGGWETPPAGQRIDLTKIERPNIPQTIPATYGSTTRFPDLRSSNPGKRVEARFRVVEAADLRTSTEPGYRTELQPRAKVDRAVVDKMVKLWDQEAAFRTESGAHGAPVVDPALDIVAGNHRVVGMRELSPEQKLAYRTELRNRAESLGIDPAAIDAMTEPILVREISAADATPELARALNTETRAMTAAEMAQASARNITPEDLRALDVGAKTSIDAALQTVAGADIVRRIVGDLPPNEMARYVNDTGGVTAEGIALTRNALLMRALPGQYDLVRGWIEDPASRTSIEAIVTGVENALPQLAEMDALIGFGQRHDVIGGTLGDAIRRVKQIREDTGVKKAERTEALRSGLDVPPLAGHLAASLDQLNGGEVTTFLRGMAEHVIRDEGNDPSQATLFGAADPRDLLRVYLDAGSDAVNDARAAKAEGSMFGWEALDHMPDQQGRAHYDFAAASGEQRTLLERDVVTPEAGIIEATSTSPATVHVGPLEAMPEGATHWSPQNAAEEGYGRALAEPRGLALDAEAVLGGITDETDYLRLIATVSAEDMTPGEYLALRSVTGVVRWTPDGRLVPDYQPGMVPHVASTISADTARLGGRDILPAGDLGAGEATLLAHDPKVEMPQAIHDMIGGDEPPVVTTLRQSTADGRHTVTTDTEAARTVAGAPKRAGKGPAIGEFNPPDIAARQAALDAELTIARARLAATEEAAAAAPPPPGPAPVFGGDPDMASLYDRYWQGGEEGAVPRPPENAWEVLDALENLDRSIPSGGLTLTEMGRLRESLHGWLDGYLTEKEKLLPKRRTAPGAPPPPTPPRPPGEVPTPAVLHREVNDTLARLGRIVFDDDTVTPLHGYEGTQYEYGPLPADLGMPPRLALDAFLDRADDTIPGIAKEILTGRKAKWGTRMGDGMAIRSLMETLPLVGRIQSVGDTMFGGRSEKQIVTETMDRLVSEVIGPEGEAAQGTLFGTSPGKRSGAAKQLHRMLADIRDHMEQDRIGFTERLGVTKYRRVGLVPDRLMQEWGEKSLRDQNRGKLPDWYQRYVADNPKLDRPIAQAWRRADNRIRAYFSQQHGGAARLLEPVYNSTFARKLSSGTRGLTVLYHMVRFATDIRWLGLEAVEAGILTLSKYGLSPFLEAHGIKITNGKVQSFRGGPKGEVNRALMPLAFGDEALGTYRRNYAWWLQSAEQGMAFGRLRHVLAIVRTEQMHRLPGELTKIARKDPQIRDMLNAFKVPESEWVRAISETWDIANSRNSLRLQQVLKPAEARRLYQPMLDRGIIDAAEFAEMVKAGRHTPNAAIEAELAHLSDPRMAPIMERIQVLNDQFWADAASLIFGQADRSNVQRFFNHPLLWWPASYMVKSGRWLGGILFDRALGHDSGMAGAWTLAQIHQRHAELLATDPDYRKELQAHPTLMFIAQMILPVTHVDLGVSLSPMTRLLFQAGETLAGDDSAPGYRRSFFSFGPFYTKDLAARFIGEEAAAAQPGSIQERVFRALEPAFPRQLTLGPSTSRLTQAEQQGTSGLPTEPYVPPLTRPPQ